MIKHHCVLFMSWTVQMSCPLADWYCLISFADANCLQALWECRCAVWIAYFVWRCKAQLFATGLAAAALHWRTSNFVVQLNSTNLFEMMNHVSAALHFWSLRRMCALFVRPCRTGPWATCPNELVLLCILSQISVAVPFVHSTEFSTLFWIVLRLLLSTP